MRVFRGRGMRYPNSVFLWSGSVVSWIVLFWKDGVL